MEEFEIIVKVQKKEGFRTFFEEVGTSETNDGRPIQILSTIPTRNTVIVFEGADYEVRMADILAGVIEALIEDEPKGEE